MSNLAKRILSALILAPAVIAILYIGGMAYKILVATACIIMLWEWFRMTKVLANKHLWWLGGVIYIIPPCLSLAYLHNGIDNPSTQLLIKLILAVWAVDIMAYVFGRTIGGAKIAPKISPNKTWAGLIGGIVGATIVFMYDKVWTDALSIAVIFAVVAQAGDFFESWIKRKCNVKDSSHIIPGHGGLLDRLDGILAIFWLTSLLLIQSHYNITALGL